MGVNLKALARRHLSTFEAFPNAAVSKSIPGLLEQSQTTLGQFDEAVTRLAGGSSPPFPFPTADDYYVWASSHKVLGDVKVPLLALNSDDDPIVSIEKVDNAVTACRNVLSCPRCSITETDEEWAEWRLQIIGIIGRLPRWSDFL